MSDQPKSDPPKFSFGTPRTTSGSTGSSLLALPATLQAEGVFSAVETTRLVAPASHSVVSEIRLRVRSQKEKKNSFRHRTRWWLGSSGSLFGQQGGGSPFSGFKLNENQKTDESKSTGNTPSLFSGGFGNNLQTPAKTTAPTSPGANQTSGLFGASTGGAPSSIFGNTSSASSGSTTPAPATSAPTFSFGGPSTTPAGPPPSNAFGTGTGTGLALLVEFRKQFGTTRWWIVWTKARTAGATNHRSVWVQQSTCTNGQSFWKPGRHRKRRSLWQQACRDWSRQSFRASISRQKLQMMRLPLL